MDDPEDFRLSPEQVAQLGDLLRRDGMRTLHLQTAKGRFAVTLGEAELVPTSLAQSASYQGETVCAATVGEFLTGHPSRPGPLVRQGARVSPGDMLGLVRTGLVFAPVILPTMDPRPATLTRILLPAGTLVGYGTPLFELERH